MQPHHRFKPKLSNFMRSVVIASILIAPVTVVHAEDQAKKIINSFDPKTMNDFIEVIRTKPDAALTNIIPAGANKFRFLFIWPASNSLMTQQRIGRSFVERFLTFAEQQRLLATGYCLRSNSLYFGSTEYGGEKLDIAYRDIEVQFKFGLKQLCNGKYVTSAELEEDQKTLLQRPIDMSRGFTLPKQVVPDETKTPEETLKPLLTPGQKAQ